MVSTYTRFLSDRRADLRQIARATRGEATLEDIEQSVWLLAQELGERRGYILDLMNPADQDFLLRCLYNQFVKYTEKLVRYAARIDEDPDDEKAGPGAIVARLLAASPGSDPLMALMREEAAEAVELTIRRSYSEAVAYLILLRRFRWSMQGLADALRIALGTLRKRIERAIDTLKVQPSLFDGIVVIAADLGVSPTGRARVTLSAGSTIGFCRADAGERTG